jgi:hypothetical protein
MAHWRGGRCYLFCEVSGNEAHRSIAEGTMGSTIDTFDEEIFIISPSPPAWADKQEDRSIDQRSICSVCHPSDNDDGNPLQLGPLAPVD